MKVENLDIKITKLNYRKLREIEFERIELELGGIPLADRLRILKEIKVIMLECGWL